MKIASKKLFIRCLTRRYFQMVESPVDSSDFVIVKDTVSHLDESIEVGYG